jgi:hypothetical protein
MDVRPCGVDGWMSVRVEQLRRVRLRVHLRARACVCALMMDGTRRCGGAQSEPRERGARAAAQVRERARAASLPQATRRNLQPHAAAKVRPCAMPAAHATCNTRGATCNIRHCTGLSALCTHASTHHRAWLSEPLLWRRGTGPPNSASLATSAAGLGSPLRLLHKQPSRR